MTPEREKKFREVLQKRQSNLTIVLENVHDPHNISAVMRTADAVGIQDIYILNTKIPQHKKWGFKSSRSAVKWLTIHQFSDAEKCFKELRNHFSKIYAAHLSPNSISLHNLNFTENIALVFGNEQNGISDEIKNFTDASFIIPQMGMIKSLNISVACAVSIYEAFRQKNNAGHYDKTSLPQQRVEDLIKQWEINL